MPPCATTDDRQDTDSRRLSGQHSTTPMVSLKLPRNPLSKRTNLAFGVSSFLPCGLPPVETWTDFHFYCRQAVTSPYNDFQGDLCHFILVIFCLFVLPNYPNLWVIYRNLFVRSLMDRPLSLGRQLTNKKSAIVNGSTCSKVWQVKFTRVLYS